MQTDTSRVFLLRSCSSDFTSFDGFQWPSTVGAECRPEAWNPEPECGDGLHGFVNGEGDAYLADWSDSAQWLVFSAPATEVVAVDRDKSKAAVARIEHVGVGETGADRLRSCLDYLASIGRLGPMAMGVVRQGGDDCTLTGGDYSRLTGGDYSRLMGGRYSALAGGRGCHLMGGAHSVLTGGNYSTLTGGAHSVLTGGDHCTLTGGHHSTLESGDHSTLTGDYGATLTGGPGSVLVFRWWDRKRQCSRLAVAVVGVDAKPNTPYTVRDGKIVEVEK